jgi:hypothetical protein
MYAAKVASQAGEPGDTTAAPGNGSVLRGVPDPAIESAAHVA